MKLLTKSKKLLLSIMMVTFIFAFSNSDIKSQDFPGDDYKPNFTEESNPYCHPYDGKVDWRGSENLRQYKSYGWGYWYECYTYYPYARIDMIEWYEKGSSTPFWYWEMDNCCKWFPAYIYIHGPAEEGGWGGVPVVTFANRNSSTGADRVDHNNPNASAGETWEPIQLSLGKTYTMKFYTNDYLRSTYYTWVYWDKDNDKEFDYRGDELLQKWTTRWNQMNYRNSPYSACPGRGYYYGGVYSFNYNNANYYWAEYEVDIEIPGDGVVIGEPNRIRLKRAYIRNNDDACLIDNMYNDWQTGDPYTNDYYGQIIDMDIEFKGIEIVPFPNEGTLTFANEEYNDEQRIPKVYQPNGAEIDFTKPEVEFIAPPSDGLHMEYSIVGPRPSLTEAYKATDALGNTRIDVSPNAISQRSVDIPDPDDPNSTIQIQRYYWKAGFTGDFDPSTNGAYVKENGNGNLLQEGELYTAYSGEYSVVINFYEADGTPVDGGTDLYYNFTIKTGIDLAIQNIVEPRPVSEPWFETHILNSARQVKADVKNIGLNPVNEFKVRYTIKGIDENTDGVLQTDTFIYTDSQYGTLEVDDIFTVSFAKLFEGKVVGDYSVVVEVYDVDGEGPDDLEQSHFNDYFPRPYGGNEADGWLVADEYVIRFVYQHDLAAETVIVPMSEPEEDTDRIYVNRPFRPIVKFANYGQQDLAQEVYTDLIIYDDNTQEVVTRVNDFEVEFVPAGLRFNTVDVRFPSQVIRKAGRYRIEASIRSIFEDPAATLIGNNTVIDYFDVEEGMQGVFTVGMLNAGKPKNFNSIYAAMDALYTFGINGDITFELTDESYELFGEPAWDFRTAIIGLGYNEEIDETFTMTWKAASNRAMIKGGVQINLNSNFGYGVRFGQGLEYPAVLNAPVNQSEDPSYINSGGHITFDGGQLKSLKFVMNSADAFAAPFYLGNGSHDITIKNVIVENANEAVNGSSVRLPIIKGGTGAGNEVEYQSDKHLELLTYSAGIVNRGQLFNFANPQVLLPAKYDIEDIDTISNVNNVFEGNEISGFGYGVVSIGMGGLYDIQQGKFVNYNGTNNKFNNNIIYDVARAAIAIGNEEMAEVKGNLIYDVNPNDESVYINGDSYDHAGIMLGGLIFETEDINNETRKLKGYNVKDILVDGNRISGVQSDNFATGIKLEQNPVYYNSGVAANDLFMPSMESNVKIINNIIKDINSTDDMASRAGVHVFTQRQYGNDLMPGDDYPTFRSLNDKILNNTIIITSSPNANSDGLLAGIGLQQAQGTEVHNNIVVIDDLNIASELQVASAVFVQGVYANQGGPNLDFNSYYVNPESNGQTVRFIEMKSNNEFRYDDWDIYKDEFTNLEQWRIESGSDKHSIEYNALNDLEISERDVKIKMTNGMLPIGSKLNNRGKKINWFSHDINGESRGQTGQRYDIGAIEFKGRQYTSDLELVRIDAPAAYRSTVADPISGADFTDAEYVMTEGAIPVVAEVRNDGSLQQNDTELTLTIFRQDNTDPNNWIEVLQLTQTASIPSSNEAFVDFGTADGIGDDFEPQTYGWFNNDKNQDGTLNTSNDYSVDSRFVGMESNVTPIYKIRVETESDENNINNYDEKEVRFYLRKTEKFLMLSVTDNQGSLESNDLNVLAGSMNTQLLKTGLSSFNWAVNPSTGQYDYDLFDRNGWEKRSVNYDMYQTLVWSDGYEQTDGGNRFSTADIRDFLASGEEIYKKNLIIASQDMVKEAEPEFVSEVLRAEYEGNPTIGTYLGTPDLYTITGVEIAETHSFEITDFSEQYLGDDEPMLHPVASGLKPLNTGENGVSYVGMKYDEFEDDFKTNAAAVATVTVTYNTVYLGLDWRHLGNLSEVFAGLLDFIETNDAPIVPVELSEFNANQQSNKVVLDWATESEVNSSLFAIEKRSSNSEIYRTIEEVSASGTSIERKNYGPYYDYDVRYGNEYIYRLKMIDKDGTSDYSEERVVTMRGEEGSIEVISVGPNPVKTESVLKLSAVGNQEISVELYDVVGNQVSTLYKGSSKTGIQEITINASELSSGVYNIVIRSGEQQIIEPISVVK